MLFKYEVRAVEELKGLNTMMLNELKSFLQVHEERLNERSQIGM